MSILYDPQSKRPQPWTYVFLFILPVLIILAIFYYGNKKAAEKHVEVPNNSAFEPAE